MRTRVIFTAYLLLVVAGLGYFIVLGLGRR
jgi:hypothetical protein